MGVRPHRTALAARTDFPRKSKEVSHRLPLLKHIFIAKRGEKGTTRHGSYTKHIFFPAEDTFCSHLLAVCPGHGMSTPPGNDGEGPSAPWRCGRERSSMSGKGKDLAMGNRFGLEPDVGAEPQEAWGNTVCAGTWRAFVLPCQPGMIALFC